MFSIPGFHFDGAVCLQIGKHLEGLDLKIETVLFLAHIRR